MTCIGTFITGYLCKMQEYFINQNWSEYTVQEHAVWQKLYKTQEEILQTRAAIEFMDNLGIVKMPPDHIPDFNKLNNQIKEKTGWTIVCVEGLVPDEIFFAMLAQRLFPSGRFIRKPWELDYLQEPDVFHDVFGHVPLLANSIFADYMQAYGKAGNYGRRMYSRR